MTTFADHPCPTCHTPPHQPCPALVRFGGAHAARVTTAKENDTSDSH